MDNTVYETQRHIDDKLDILRQQVHFVSCRYDYHHKNNELEILQRKICLLEKAASTYKSFVTQQRKLLEAIDTCKQKSYLVDTALDQVCQSKLSPPELDSSISENKENL